MEVILFSDWSAVRSRRVLNICYATAFIIAYLIVIENNCNFRNVIYRQRMEYEDDRPILEGVI
jgi:hypothetical protein